MNRDMPITDNRLITFHLSGHDFAVPIAVVLEVTSAEKIDELPGAMKPLEGLMIYRDNQALPIFSLIEALGQEHDNSGDLIMVVELDKQILGFRVDRIGRIVDGLGNDHYDSEEEVPDINPEAVRGVISEKGLRVVVLRLEKVFVNVLN